MRQMIAKILVVALLITAMPLLIPNHAEAGANGMIRVLLTRLNSPTSLTMRTSGTYSINGVAIPSGATVQATVAGTQISLSVNGAVYALDSKITLYRTQSGVTNGLTFTSPAISNLNCGDLILTVSGGKLVPVLSIYIETYLYGVVGYEMSNAFPQEALRTQAICARTYAMRAKSSSGTHDLQDNANSQVFRGYPSSYTNVIEAVNATRGMCLMYNNSYVACYYSSSNGGQTELPSNPWGGTSAAYFKMVDDPYDLQNPSSPIRTHKVPATPSASNPINSLLNTALIEAMAAELRANGMRTDAASVRITQVKSIEPHTPRYAAPSKTFQRLRFTVTVDGVSTDGSAKTADLTFNIDTYAKLKALLSLGINSSNNELIYVEQSGADFLICFRRWGHGIGMSQRGAQTMARDYNKNYREILDFYYPGTTVTQLTLDDTSGTISGEPVPAETPNPNGYITLRPGSTGQLVKNLQTRLKELGYFTGSIGGNYLTLTTDAVKRYQRAMGLPEDGIASPELQEMLFGAQATPPPPDPSSPYVTLRPGSTGQAVRNLQTRLKELGYFTGDIGGNYLTLTTDAVTRYQRAMGLPQDGIATPALQEMIFGPQPDPTPTPEPTPPPSQAPTPPPSTSQYVTLRSGFSGQAVKNLQTRLKELGYFTGSIGGNYLTLTTDAVKKYQKAMGLPQDGIATPELQEMIFGAQSVPAPTTAPTAPPPPSSGNYTVIRPNEAGDHVKTLQTRLKALGYFSGSIGGNYLSITTNAVKAFQKKMGLKQDGIATVETQMLLYGGAVKKSASAQYANTNSATTLRAEASSGSSSVASVSSGTKVQILSKLDQWTRVKVGTKFGYLPNSALGSSSSSSSSSSTTGTIKLSNTGSFLNVRKTTSTSSASLTTLKHGAKVTILGTSGSWYKISANGKTGYVQTKYVVRG